MSAGKATTAQKRPGRNEACACGSGLKYKKCCLLVERANVLKAREEQKRIIRERAEAAAARRRELGVSDATSAWPTRRMPLALSMMAAAAMLSSSHRRP